MSIRITKLNEHPSKSLRRLAEDFFRLLFINRTRALKILLDKLLKN